MYIHLFTVGYNLNNNALRGEIHDFMKLLNGPHPNKPHNLYKELVYIHNVFFYWQRLTGS
jgi:hypothetical protein